MTNEVSNGTTGAAAAVRRPDYSITDAEVSVIKTVAQAAPGSWSAVDFVCECCGNTAVSIGPTCDAAIGPRFELSRDKDQRILLTTTWFNGEDYVSEFWSLKAALRSVLTRRIVPDRTIQPALTRRARLARAFAVRDEISGRLAMCHPPIPSSIHQHGKANEQHQRSHHCGG